jgi:hypothetical protein
MPHGFAGSVGKLKASTQALDAVGTFVAQRSALERALALVFARK